MQIDLILGVLAFSGIVLTLVMVIIGARSKLVSTGDVSIEINGDSSNPLVFLLVQNYFKHLPIIRYFYHLHAVAEVHAVNVNV